MRYFIAFFIIVLAATILHYKTVEHTPVMEEVNQFFGGVLSNNVAVDTTVETTNTATEISSPGIVWVSDTNGYIFYEDSGGGLSMSSTTDSGATWSAARTVDPQTDVVSFAIWWEGWTPGTTTTRYIHVATTDTGGDATWYTRVDTQTGAISTTHTAVDQVAVCADGSDCYTSITMSATGTLMMTGTDAADSWVVRCGVYNGCTSAANWHEITGAFGTIADLGNDYPILFPIGGTDNIALVYWDISADTLDWNQFSATSSSWWFTTPPNIQTALDDNLTYDAQLLGAALATTTGVAAVTMVGDANDYTTADHDVQFWTYSSTTGWSYTANVVTDASGAIIGAKVAYDATNAIWYSIYGRRTIIGTNTTGGIYYRTSTDGGSSWSAESAMVNDNADDINGMSVNIIGHQRIGVTWNYTTAPRADQQFYDDIADLIADGGGGGGTTPPAVNTVIWFD